MNIGKLKQYSFSCKNFGEDTTAVCYNCKAESKMIDMYGDLDIFPYIDNGEEFIPKYYCKKCA